MRSKEECPEISEFIVGLAKGAARELRRGWVFKAEDREDLEQELTLHLWECCADEIREGRLDGEDARARIITLLNRKKGTLVRARIKLRRNEVSLPDVWDGSVEGPEAQTVMKLQLQSAMESLPPKSRRIATLIYEGFTFAEAARKLGMSPTGVGYHKGQIRKAFEKAGLRPRID